MMACRRLDLTDSAAQRFCLGCGATWRIPVERCAKCGSITPSREQLEAELARSVPGAPSDRFGASSLGHLRAARDEAERELFREQLAELEVPFVEYEEPPCDGEDAGSGPLVHFFVDEGNRERADQGLLAHLASDGSVLLVRAADAVEAATIRARLEAAGIDVTASQFSQQFAVGVGQQGETQLWVAERDLAAARAALRLDRDEADAAPPFGPEEAATLEQMQAGRRFRIVRWLLYFPAAAAIVQGLVLLFVPALWPALGSVAWGLALAGLALWSRREPARAFAAALGLAFTGLVAVVLLAPKASELLRVPGLFGMVMLYFAWQRARDGEREKPRKAGVRTA
jgi:hypothetical protein